MQSATHRDRGGGQRLLERFALVAEQRANLGVDIARHHDVADFERAGAHNRVDHTALAALDVRFHHELRTHRLFCSTD